ncbi:hypothetical protein ABS71_14335 [bacterium SCN 62-11]|nr:HTTM domain-containing protein [Candidatus Eremiobacteraeota bacterium]ODT63432.1 MAG: hypothetical protein ABS71_14335 [bacterium SCN 62-11]
MLILSDLALQLPDLGAFYSDEGIMPRALLLSVQHRTFPNLHMLSGSLLWVGLLHAATAGAALSLLLGYRSRLACAACWFLLHSLHYRNPWLLDAGHSEMRLVLFWCMFLPLDGASPEEKNCSSPATLGYTLQIGLIYLFAAISKSDPVWTREHTALYYVLNQDAFATGLAHWVRQSADSMRVLTQLALALEWSIPFLLWWRRTRWLGLVLLLVFHLSIAALLRLGMMVPTALVCALGLLPRAPRPPSLRPGTPCTLPGPVRGLLYAACGYIFYINVAVLRLWAVPMPVQAFGYVFQLFQSWPMFAPHPGRADGWFVIEGVRRDGTSVDLWRGGQPVDWRVPEDFAPLYPSQRWRCWLLNLYDKREPEVSQRFLEWACRGRQDLYYARLIYVNEETPPPGKPFMPTPEILAERKFPY